MNIDTGIGVLKKLIKVFDKLKNFDKLKKKSWKCLINCLILKNYKKKVMIVWYIVDSCIQNQLKLYLCESNIDDEISLYVVFLFFM